MKLTGMKIHCQTWFGMNTALKSPVGPDPGLRTPMGARSEIGPGYSPDLLSVQEPPASRPLAKYSTGDLG